MNKYLQKFARDSLKEWLPKLTNEQQHIFKCMYSHLDLKKPIDEVVELMPSEKLDWAMIQVQNSLKKI